MTTDFTKIYKEGLEHEKTTTKKVEHVTEAEATKVLKKANTSNRRIQIPPVQPQKNIKESSFTQLHIIREEIRREMTEEVINKLREEVTRNVEKELTKVITESVRKELETQTANSNLILAEAMTLLMKKIDKLGESLKIEIPTPIVNAIFPSRKKVINRDANGLIESIDEVEDE